MTTTATRTTQRAGKPAATAVKAETAASVDELLTNATEAFAREVAPTAGALLRRRGHGS